MPGATSGLAGAQQQSRINIHDFRARERSNVLTVMAAAWLLEFQLSDRVSASSADFDGHGQMHRPRQQTFAIAAHLEAHAHGNELPPSRDHLV
jgi:hypothetical protein